MINIAIHNRQKLLAIETQRLTDACRQVVEGAGHNSARISLVVVEDNQMKELNQQYLNHDYPTDVLSFPLSGEGEPLEGEIVVSADTAMANAAEYGTRPKEELLLYVIHGALHLIGLGDKEPAEAETMRQAEAYWLEELGIPRDRATQLAYPDRPLAPAGEPTE